MLLSITDRVPVQHSICLSISTFLITVLAFEWRLETSGFYSCFIFYMTYLNSEVRYILHSPPDFSCTKFPVLAGLLACSQSTLTFVLTIL